MKKTVFKRKIYDEMLEWKRESAGETALLIEGSRRVGKSTIVRHFAEREYKSHLIIDFANTTEDVKSLFQNLGEIDSFFSHLKILTGKTLHERESVIIFDEVQMCPHARQAIKYLVADGRYDYIETGSLLSIKQNVENIVIPSEEEVLELGPLDFEEFLWAMGEHQLADLIKHQFQMQKPLPDALHCKASGLFREYMLVGGMPKPVDVYAAQRSFEAADREKRRILQLYRNDVSRFARGYEFKVASILDGIPGQLAKHEKKFTLSSISKNARMRTYEEAFFWLADARIANICYAANDPSVGLSLSMEQSSLKCYMADTGLLVSLAFADDSKTAENVYRTVLRGELGINEGMLTENVVAQMLVARGHHLFFYSQSGRTEGEERMEIDFLIQKPYEDAAGKPRISPIEVKSPRQYGTTSLDRFKKRFGKRIGVQYVLHPKQMKVEQGRVYLPLYMGMCL